MKKPYQLIAIGVLALIVVGFLKDKPTENLSASADINEELSYVSLKKSASEKTVDFSACDPKQSFSVGVGNESNQLKILGPEEENCIAQTIFEVESGYYINECKIPLSTGRTTFEGGGLDNISQFCTLKTTGNGLLELE